METNTPVEVTEQNTPATPTVPEVVLPTTPEELSRLLQVEGDKRAQQASQTTKAKIEAEFLEKLETEKSEAAKLAKMSAEQRKQAEFDKKFAEFESKQKEFELQKMEIETIKQMEVENLPISFAKILIGENAEKTNENIINFKKAWDIAIKNEVDGKLKGSGTTVIKTGVSPSATTKEEFAKMDYPSRMNLFNTNKELYDRLLNS